METIRFNGYEFVAKRQARQLSEVKSLTDRGITPTLNIILAGVDAGSIKYLEKKTETLTSIGANVDTFRFNSEVAAYQLTGLINELNQDPSVHGIIPELPLPEAIRSQTHEVVMSVKRQKDVDGLGPNPLYTHATALAIKAAMEEGMRAVGIKKADSPRIAVVGAKGMVGSRVANLLEKKKYYVVRHDIETSLKDLAESTRNSQIIINTVSKTDFITREMVRQESIVLDVSFWGGVHPDVYKWVSFYNPKVGGIGPATVDYLGQNLLRAASRAARTCKSSKLSL